MTEGEREPDGDAGVRVVTFGCRLNGVESEAMAQAATAAGHRNLAIVNTCAVTAEAVRQGRQAIRRLRRERPDRPVVVTGCAAAIDAAGFAAMPEVDRLLPNRTKAAPETWQLDPAAAGPAGARRQTRGFVAVQNGCDHRCTFCVIPFGRGESRSLPEAEVVAQARALWEAGAREVVLTGVDITAYGADLPHRPSLGALVGHLLACLPGLERLRLSSLDCVEADATLLELIAHEPRLMPHLHLSLQSGADMILKRMKRRHSRADAIALAGRLRAARPDIALGADLIVGFPTESDTHFADSVSLVEACGLSHLHVFPYSPRPNTAAARMPPVPAAVVKARAATLRDAGSSALRRHLGAQLGRTLPVLMERGNVGRAPDFSLVRPAGAVPAGTLLPLSIRGHDGTALHGTATLS